MKMTMKEIASRIRAHLKRFEADPKINAAKPYGRAGNKFHPYWNVGSRAAGRFVYVTYVSYQGTSHLTRDDAENYLAWLDAGNIGTHYETAGVR